MKYQQGDIVEINFLFPNGEFKPHPALIISNNYLQEIEEGCVYLVLITSKSYNEEFCYHLTEEMLSFKMLKQSYVKCHIISGNTTRDIVRKLGFVKQPYFEEIKNKVILSVF